MQGIVNVVGVDAPAAATAAVGGDRIGCEHAGGDAVGIEQGGKLEQHPADAGGELVGEFHRQVPGGGNDRLVLVW